MNGNNTNGSSIKTNGTKTAEKGDIDHDESGDDEDDEAAPAVGDGTGGSSSYLETTVLLISV